MIRTPRLLLRGWRDEDLKPFAALNADPEVMRHFPAPLDASASDELARGIRSHIDEHGWGLWAVQVTDAASPLHGRLVGFTGLSRPGFDAPFTPAVEVGWRLDRSAWGNGYATEAARAALRFGFEELALEEIVSMTSAGNMRSRAVMERLGMTRCPADDFEHPRVEPSSPLRAHVLYRITGLQDQAPPESPSGP